MAKLRRSFERAGFTHVNTVLASGNVAFDSPAAAATALARKAQAATAKHLGRSFYTIVRPRIRLRALVEADPFARRRLPVNAKRVVTFLGKPPSAKRSFTSPAASPRPCRSSRAPP
jgi:uncharacterized protein (DUF1697 family)